MEGAAAPAAELDQGRGEDGKLPSRGSPGADCPPTLEARPVVLAGGRGWPPRRPPPGTQAPRTRLQSLSLRVGPVAAAGDRAAWAAEAGAG